MSKFTRSLDRAFTKMEYINAVNPTGRITYTDIENPANTIVIESKRAAQVMYDKHRAAFDELYAAALKDKEMVDFVVGAGTWEGLFEAACCKAANDAHAKEVKEAKRLAREQAKADREAAKLSHQSRKKAVETAIVESDPELVKAVEEAKEQAKANATKPAETNEATGTKTAYVRRPGMGYGATKWTLDLYNRNSKGDPVKYTNDEKRMIKNLGFKWDNRNKRHFVLDPDESFIEIIKTVFDLTDER